jgi:hypothetical protein
LCHDDACSEATPEDTALLGERSSVACSATSLATGADNHCSRQVIVSLIGPTPRPRLGAYAQLDENTYQPAIKIPDYHLAAVNLTRDEFHGDKIAFTGSTETGRQIAAQASKTLKLVTFELGGKSPNIVFPNPDLEAAVQRSAYGLLGRRTIVHGGLADPRACVRPRRVRRALRDQG